MMLRAKERVVFVAACLLIAGCGGPSPARPDAGSAPGDGRDPNGASPSVTVRPLSGGTGPVFTKGPHASFVISVSDVAERVEVLLDGAVVSTIPGPTNYVNHDVDVASLSEGTHALAARATRQGVTGTSPTLELVVDRTSPTVAQLTPAPGSAYVGLHAPITAWLSEPVERYGLKADSVRCQVLEEGQTTTRALGLTHTLAADAQSVTVTLTTAFTLPARVTCRLTTDYFDRANNHLAETAWTWDFPAWLPAGNALSGAAGSTDALEPALAVDAAGRAYVAWREGSELHVRSGTGDSWQAVGAAVTASAGASLRAPRLALPAQGGALLAYVESGTGGGAVRVAQLGSAAWSPVGDAVSGGDGLDADSGLALVADADGHPVIAFDAPAGTQRKGFVFKHDGAAWVALGSGGIAAPTNTSLVRSPSLVLDAAGAPVLAIEGRTASTNEPAVTVLRWSGTAWTTLGGSPALTGHWLPVLQRRPDGVLALAAHGPQGSGGATPYAFTYGASLGSWSSAPAGIPVAPEGIAAERLAFAVGPAWGTVMGWVEPVGSSARVFAAALQDDYASPRPYAGLQLGSGSASGLTPVAAVGADGTPWLAWSEGDGTARSVYVVRENR